MVPIKIKPDNARTNHYIPIIILLGGQHNNKKTFSVHRISEHSTQTCDF